MVESRLTIHDLRFLRSNHDSPRIESGAGSITIHGLSGASCRARSGAAEGWKSCAAKVCIPFFIHPGRSHRIEVIEPPAKGRAVRSIGILGDADPGQGGDGNVYVTIRQALSWRFEKQDSGSRIQDSASCLPCVSVAEKTVNRD